MGCFCKDTVAALADKIAGLAPMPQSKMQSIAAAQAQATDTADSSATTPADTSAQDTPAQEQQIAALARWVQTRMPQTPWQPDPAWAAMKLPPAPLEPTAMATLTALAQAQQQIAQTLAVDLLQPAAATAFRRVVATLNQRTQDLPTAPDPAPWQKLAATAVAVQQVEQAVANNLFNVTPQLRQAFEQPGGMKLSAWRDFYQQVKDLAPLLAVTRQLQVNLANPDAAAQLAQKLRPLRQASLPPLEAPWTIAQYTALAGALGQIEQVLGVDPTERDPAELQQIVSDRQQRILQKLQVTEAPPLPASVANVVTPNVVKALQAVSPQTLQAMRWQVPPATQFPLVTSGLPAIAFIDALAQMKIDAVQQSPCGQQCDAAAMLRQAS